MDKIIYNHLINHKHNDNNQIFLDCLLILSINKININYYTLLEYCNNIINNNHTNNDTILNNNQFQLFNKIINSININNNNKIKTQSSNIIDDHPISKNKFDCSILIIIENNLKLQQQEQQQEQQEKQPKQQQQHNDQININKKLNNYNYYYLLFKKVWNNLIIRNEIIFYLRIYNFHMNQITIKYKELNDYKYRNYLNNVKLECEGDWDSVFSSEIGEMISSSVTKLELYNFKYLQVNSIPTTVNTLILGGLINQKLTRDMFINSRSSGGSGNNITELIFGIEFNQSLGEWLPCNLKSLVLGESFQQDILPGQLPNSLTSLILHEDYNGTILPNSIPKSVTTLNYTFNSRNNQNKLNRLSIPPSTTKLIFDNSFDQDIEIGFIPHNVTSIKFQYSFNSIIKPNSLPNSIKSIKFGFKFNQFLNLEMFPIKSNLTSLKFGNDFNKPIINNNHQICLPNSITKLHFGYLFNQSINNDTLNYFSKLKQLKIGKFNNSSEFDIGVFPNSITSLNLNEYKHPLKPNLLPRSLKSLSYSFNYPIPINTLPNSISSLEINNQTNLPNPLPTNLKSITIKSNNNNYDEDISLINLPTSFESIYINSQNFKLFNKLPIDFFIQFIKPLTSS